MSASMATDGAAGGGGVTPFWLGVLVGVGSCAGMVLLVIGAIFTGMWWASR